MSSFYAVPMHGAETEDMFSGGGASSLSAPLEIRQSFLQRLRSVDWLDWLSALSMLALMYAVFLSYFVGLLAAAEAIRGENFRVLPERFYGPFVYGTEPPVPLGYASYPAGFPVPWNATLF